MSGDRVPDIIAVMKHPKFFAKFFPGDTWQPWHVAGKAIYALPMTAPELETLRHHTGLTTAPAKKALEIFLVISRRAGKSIFAAVNAVYIAFFRDWRPFLAPGERALIVVICPDRSQARVIFGYIVALVESVPELQAMVEKKYTERLVLANSVEIVIATANYASIRGASICAAFVDELAFMPTDFSAQPDKELLNALRPAMATFGEHALLYCSSSPFARKGELWKASEKYYGKPGETLIWKATSLEMNPTLNPKMIARAFEEDPVRAAAEWGGEFRRDVESFVSPEAVSAVTISGRRELAPQL